jgi:small subunit ribosomal protein S8
MKKTLYDDLTAIKNKQMTKKPFIMLRQTKILKCFLDLLWDEGYILGYKISQNLIKVVLKYHNQSPVIKSLKLVSKPSQKRYYSARQIWKITSSQEFFVLSTSKGLKSLINCKKENIGGELFIIIS